MKPLRFTGVVHTVREAAADESPPASMEEMRSLKPTRHVRRLISQFKRRRPRSVGFEFWYSKMHELHLHNPRVRFWKAARLQAQRLPFKMRMVPLEHSTGERAVMHLNRLLVQAARQKLKGNEAHAFFLERARELPGREARLRLKVLLNELEARFPKLSLDTLLALAGAVSFSRSLHLLKKARAQSLDECAVGEYHVRDLQFLANGLDEPDFPRVLLPYRNALSGLRFSGVRFRNEMGRQLDLLRFNSYLKHRPFVERLHAMAEQPVPRRGRS